MIKNISAELESVEPGVILSLTREAAIAIKRFIGTSTHNDRVDYFVDRHFERDMAERHATQLGKIWDALDLVIGDGA